MNQKQRDFFVYKIQARLEAEIKALKASLPELPDFSIALKEAAINGTLKMCPEVNVMAFLKSKSLKADQRDGAWVENQHRYDSSIGRHESALLRNMLVTDLFMLPDGYKKKWDEYVVARTAVDGQIKDKEAQVDAMITRVKLSSAKALQAFVDDIDSIGQIRLSGLRDRLNLGAGAQASNEIKGRLKTA